MRSLLLFLKYPKQQQTVDSENLKAIVNICYEILGVRKRKRERQLGRLSNWLGTRKTKNKKGEKTLRILVDRNQKKIKDY